MPIKDFLAPDGALLLDVRSPTEFAQGHIPGAVNFPLFTDEERAKVGTLYKQKGPEPALILGLEIVGPKMADFVRQASHLNPDRQEMRMYCFRGGQRSQSLSWLLGQAGFSITLLRGGYKAYRRAVLESFQEPQEIVVLSGCTGAGKTRLLQALERRGQQILDLEGQASHRGSAFGGYEQPASLTTEMYQNLLHLAWSRLDRRKPVWIEDEGRTLGKLQVPDDIWTQMRRAPVVFLDIAQEHRVELLVQEYGDYGRDLLRASIDRIARRLGGVTHQRCLVALEEGNYREVVRHCLDYYDKAYLHCVRKRNQEPFWSLSLPGIDTEHNAEALLEFVASVEELAASAPSRRL